MMKDPLSNLYHKQQIGRAVLLSTCLLLCAGGLLITIVRPSWSTISSSVWTSGLCVILTLWFLSGRKTLHSRRRQYQRVLAHDSALLAPGQPSPLESTFSLPMTIVLRPQNSMMRPLYISIACIASLFTGLTILALLLFFMAPYNTYYTGDDPFFAAITGSIALFLGWMLWFLWSHSRYWVKVTDTGLEGRFQGHKMRITWGNARFFSIDGVIDSKRPHLYTLSGEQGGIIWLQLPSENPARLYQPILPFDQYQQQSVLLLQIIVAQTGLPLYDLRRPANKWNL